VKEETRSDLRTMAFAAGCSVLLHLLLLWLAPPHFQPMHLVLTAPLEVQRATTQVPDSRLAPSMREIPVEINARANRETPVNPTPFVAARSQRAAQPTPETKATKSSLPTSQGEDSKSVRVAQGKPLSQEELSKAAPEGQAGTASAEVGVMPKVGQSPTPSDASAPPPDPDRPRLRAGPAGTTGYLLRNNVGVNRVGRVAVDARFSNYGDYAQRMMEAIQSTWWDILFRARLERFQPGDVIVRFKLHRDGSVSDLVVVESGVSTMRTFACKDAISACAPFDAWRPDMVAQFGEVDVVTIRFIYH
jgi:outer membrane biosynthesis protein TonB